MLPHNPRFDERIIFTPADGPPEVERPSPEIYAAMTETGIRRMIQDFYTSLAASPIRPLFDDDMPAAAERSADYFIQLLGGPPIYQSRRGAPRLRQRHLPFRITEEARRIWLHCFEGILDHATDYGFPPEHLPGFHRFLDSFSAWMVNTR